MNEFSIYIYCWSYDKSISMPVKEEYEIHNFSTNKDLSELENEKWLIDLMQQIEKKHLELHPNCDRYPTAQIGYDNFRPSLKPEAKQISIDEYTLFTDWQTSLKGKKFRHYQKRNEVTETKDRY